MGYCILDNTMASTAPPIIPSATNPGNRGNLRLKSLSLREIDSDALSLSVDLTVLDERLSFTASKADGSRVNMFSAIGGTMELTTLSVSSILAADISASGNFAINSLSVGGVTSDLSIQGQLTASRISVQDAYFGHVEVFGANTLSVGGNVIFDGEKVKIVGESGVFEVERQVSAGGSITTASLLSVGSHARIGGDTRIAGSAYAALDLSVGGDTRLGADVGIAGRLDVDGAEVTFANGLSVGGAALVRGPVTTAGGVSTSGSLLAAGKLSVGQAVRLSSVLSVLSTSTFHGAMSTHGRAIFSQDLSVGQALVSNSLSTAFLGTFGSLSAGTTTASLMNIISDLSVGGNLIVQGNVTTLNTHQVDIEDPIIEIGTGSEGLAGVKIIKDTVETNNQSGIFREAEGQDGTEPFFAVYEDFSIRDPLNPVKLVANFRTGQLSTNANAIFGGPLSVGGSVFIEGIDNSLVMDGSISVQGGIQAEGSVSVGGDAALHGNAELHGALSVTGAVTLGEALSVSGAADVAGAARLGSGLSVGANGTIGSDLSIGAALRVMGQTVVDASLSVGQTSVLSSTLSVGAGTIIGGTLSIGEDVFIHRSLSVADVAVLTRSAGSNVFVVVPDTNLTLTGTDGGVVNVMEFDEMPVQVTLRALGRTDIVYTQFGTATGPPIAFNPSTSKYELLLQYISGTVNPVLQPEDIVIQTPRPYVSKASFVIRNVISGAFVHNLNATIPKDIFSIDSGHVVPTVSVSGDIIAGSALSVGHDIHCHGNTLFSNGLKRVGILGKLSVNGDLNVNHRMTIGGLPGASLSVGADIVCDSGLSIAQAAVLSSALSVGADVVISGDIYTSSGLSVNGPTSMNGPVTLHGTLSVADSVVVDDILSVARDAFIGLNLSVGAAVITNTLSAQSMDSAAVSVNALHIDWRLLNAGVTHLKRGVTCGSTLSVSSDAFIGSRLSVGNDAHFAGSVATTGTLSLNSSMYVTEGAVFNDTVDVRDSVQLGSILSVSGNVCLREMLSVGMTAEISGNLLAHGTTTLNNRLSVGRTATVTRMLSVGDTITGGRDLSVGGLVLDRTRTHNRYHITGTPTNGGLQITTTSAGLNFIFSMTDGRLVTSTSIDEQGTFVARSPNVQVEWIEVDAGINESNFLEVLNLGDLTTLYQLDVPNALLAGLTALSVGHNMTVGAAGEQTFLSVGSSMDVAHRVQMGDTLSVSGKVTADADVTIGGAARVHGPAALHSSVSIGSGVTASGALSVGSVVTLASSLSIGGDAEIAANVRGAGSMSVQSTLDVVSGTRLHASLSTHGSSTFGGALSIGGRVDVSDEVGMAQGLSVGGGSTVTEHVSIGTFATVGEWLAVAGGLSVGEGVDVASGVIIGSDISAGGSAYVGADFTAGGDLRAHGDAWMTGQVSIGSDLYAGGALALRGNAVMNQSLSVASMLATPVAGSNTFTFTQPIREEDAATILRIELGHPHVASLISNQGLIGLTAAVASGRGTFVSVYTNDSGITQGIGQISGFLLDDVQNASNESLRYMTEQEVLNVEFENGANLVTLVHSSSSTPPGLVGGKRAPTLSVGGQIVLLEDLSVGFNTTIQGSLSVGRAVRAAALSVQSASIGSISTGSIFVASSSLDDVACENLSVSNAFMHTAIVQDSLSVSGPVTFESDSVVFNGQTLVLQQDLSVGGLSQLNLLSVSNACIDFLSVQSSITGELSVHTLFVQQVTTNNPDESFDFQDDAHFQGDLTIEGKLFVKDIIYTGPGGAFTIENVAALTVSGSISTASLILDITNPPSDSSSDGSPGLFTFDPQYLYMCIAENTWRRVAMSIF